jgi:hypothetical protein
MKNKDEGPLGKESEESKRRTFLKLAVGGAFGSVLVTHSADARDSGLRTPCGVISASDSILIYINMVFLILNEAYRSKGKRDIKKLADCMKAFKLLYEKIDQLCVELGNSRMTTQAGQLGELAEVGRANLRLIDRSVSYSRDAMRPILAGLSVVGQQLCWQCQKLLPEGEIKLSQRARTLLNDIIELIDRPDLKELYKGQVPNTEEVDPEAQWIENTVLRDLRDSIYRARSAIVEVENPLATSREINKEKLWNEAKDSLRAALSALKELVLRKERQTATGVETKAYVETMLPESFWATLPKEVLTKTNPLPEINKDVKELKNADSLALMLCGLLRLIDKPEYQNGSLGDSGRSSFTVVTYTPFGGGVPPPAPDRQSQISQLLWQHCPPGTQPQVDNCLAVLLGIKGLDSWFTWPVRTWLIWMALSAAQRVSRITCEDKSDLWSLAAGLKDLV